MARKRWSTRSRGGITTRFQTELSAEIPAGWDYKEEITIVAGDGKANVLSSSAPWDGDDDAEAYAKEIGSQYEEAFPGYRQLASEEITAFGGRSGWLRRFEHEPDPGRTIVQLQIYCIDAGRVYTATATASGEDFDAYQPELVSILTSVDIDPRVGIGANQEPRAPDPARGTADEDPSG